MVFIDQRRCRRRAARPVPLLTNLRSAWLNPAAFSIFFFPHSPTLSAFFLESFKNKDQNVNVLNVFFILVFVDFLFL